MLGYLIINILFQIINFTIYSVDNFKLYNFSPNIVLVLVILSIIQLLYYMIFSYYNIDNVEIYIIFDTIISIVYLYLFGFYYYDIEFNNIEQFLLDIHKLKQENLKLKKNIMNLREYNIKFRYDALNNLNISTIDKPYNLDKLIYKKMNLYNEIIIEEILPKYLNEENINKIKIQIKSVFKELKDM